MQNVDNNDLAQNLGYSSFEEVPRSTLIHLALNPHVLNQILNNLEKNNEN